MRRLGDAGLDVGATVAQMDAAVAALRDTWNQVNAKWVVLLTSGQADAADGRIASLKGLIDDLDVGGVAREHVFFPLEGQTQDDAWATWKDTANYVKAGLAQVGGFITNWSLSSVLPRVAADVGDQASKLGSWVLWAVGGLLAFEVLRTFAGGRSQQLSGFSRRRRRRRLRR